MHDAPLFLFITIQICSLSLSCDLLKISLIYVFPASKNSSCKLIKQSNQPVHTLFCQFCTHLFYIEGNGQEGKVHEDLVLSKMSETFVVHLVFNLSENGMEAYVKYNYFHMEQRPRFKPDPFKAENFYYNEEHDFCICPMGQRMRRIGTRNVKTASGYVNENPRYSAVRCEGCPLRCRCYKAKGTRTIELNHSL